MKRLLFLLVLLGFTLCFSQTNESETTPTKDHSGGQYNTPRSKAAEYPGGMMKLRKDVAEKINLKKIKVIKDTTVSKANFTVNIKGKIENIIVTGDNTVLNKEVERALKSLKTQWKPAELNGVMVRSFYSFPTTITSE